MKQFIIFNYSNDNCKIGLAIHSNGRLCYSFKFAGQIYNIHHDPFDTTAYKCDIVEQEILVRI